MATASRIGWRVTLGLAAVAAAVTGAVAGVYYAAADSMLVLVALSTMLSLFLCWYWSTAVSSAVADVYVGIVIVASFDITGV